MDACARAGMWTKALSLLDKLRTAGLKPDAIAYATAINAAAKVNNWNLCFQLLNEQGAEGIKPDARRYYTLFICVSIYMCAITVSLLL
jgi:pentatricopeptide repeat protein